MLSHEIAFENNEGMLETFGSNCINIVIGQGKSADKSENNRLQQEATEHACKRLSIRSVWTQTFVLKWRGSESDVHLMLIGSYPTLYLSDSHLLNIHPRQLRMNCQKRPVLCTSLFRIVIQARTFTCTFDTYHPSFSCCFHKSFLSTFSMA